MAWTVHTGAFQPYLEASLLDEVGRFRAADSLAPLTVLTPNYQLVRHLKARALEKFGGLFNVRFSTLQHLLMDALDPLFLSQGRRRLTGSMAPWALKGSLGPLLRGKGPFTSLLETPGFHRAFASLLAELRQAGYDAASLRSTLRRAKSDPAAAERIHLYADALETFESWKRTEGWYDAEDLLCAAADSPTAFNASGSVWFYGFYDATFLQERALRSIGGRDAFWFVPYLETPAFEYAAPFVRRLLAGGGRRSQAPDAPSGDFLGRLPGNLFHPAAGLERAEEPHAFESSPLKVLLCPGERREARELARLVRAEAARLNVDYGRCAFLLRSPGAAHDLILGEMDAQGLPRESRVSVPLSRSVSGKAFLRLLEALLGGFERGAVMDFLSSPGVDPSAFLGDAKDWAPARWDALSKEAGVVAGRAQWRQRLGRWMDERSSRDRDEGNGPGVEDAQNLTRVVGALGKVASALEEEKDWGEALRSLEGWTRRHFLPGAGTDELLAVLAGSSWISGLSKGLDDADLLRLLSALVEDEATEAAGSVEGGVLVLDLMQSRGVPHDVVLIPGLVEKSLPLPPRMDPFLHDDDREALNQAAEGGRRIALKREGAREERLLYSLAVFSARRALVLGAPVLDPQKGVERVPSLFLFETLRALTGVRPTDLSLCPNTVREVALDGWARINPLECAEEMELAFTVTSLARGGTLGPALGYLRRHPLALGGFRAARSREGTKRFGPHEGIVPPAGENAPNAPWRTADLSPSRVECYARCPQMYFYRYVLGLTSVDEPEEALESDPQDLGTLLHRALEKVVERGFQEGWLARRDKAAALQAAGEEADRWLASHEKDGVTGAPCLWAWRKGSLRADLLRAVARMVEDEAWAPSSVERSLEGAAPLDAGEGCLLRLKGRVDRFDVSADGRAFRVVDYKSGSATDYANNTFRGGRRIQLGLYLWAGRSLFPSLVPHGGVYEFLTAKGAYKRVGLEVEDWASMESKLRLFLRETRDGVRKGVFPPAPSPEACAHCDYWTLCGSGMERRAERKAGDPVLEGLHRMREVP